MLNVCLLFLSPFLHDRLRLLICNFDSGALIFNPLQTASLVIFRLRRQETSHSSLLLLFFTKFSLTFLSSLRVWRTNSIGNTTFMMSALAFRFQDQLTSTVHDGDPTRCSTSLKCSVETSILINFGCDG